jgi:hypothetical protein
MPARLELNLTLDDGSRRDLVLITEGAHATLPPLLAGRHELRFGDTLCRITAAPPSCYLPPSMEAGQRHFGVTAQSYSLRHAADQGMGDFTAIAELARPRRRRGALWLGISPPHALHPTERERASPYQPSDRRFLEPMLIDVSRLGAAGGSSRAPQADWVDYPAVWQAKRRLLHAAWTASTAPIRLSRPSAPTGGPALERFAAFNALAERAGHSDARRWPAGLRHGRDAGRRLLRTGGRGGRLPRLAAVPRRPPDGGGRRRRCRPLSRPRRRHRARRRRVLVRRRGVPAGLSIGAPPDLLGPLGQVWGVPPPDPIASEASRPCRLRRAHPRQHAPCGRRCGSTTCWG